MPLPLPVKLLAVKKAFIIVFGILSQWPLQAQLNIYIEDKTEQGFKLVVNKYWQNENLATSLYLKNLKIDTNYKIGVVLGNQALLSFKRQLKLSQGGTHHYVIMTNYQGTPQLRYRGLMAQPPAATPAIAYHKTKAFIPSGTLASLSLKDTSQIVALANKPAEAAIPHPAKAVIQAKDTMTTRVVADALPPEIALPKILSFNEHMAHYERLEFEFEKLNYAQNNVLNLTLNTAQLIRVLKGFKYDQTRLQFLKLTLKNQGGNGLRMASVLEVFDYDLSRQEANKLIP